VSSAPSEDACPFAAADLHVVLVAPEIHWNTGNAGRTCLAAGAQLHLVRPLGFSLAERQLRRAGLDYWARVAPVLWDDWESLERALPAPGAIPQPGGPREPWLLSAEAPRELWSARFEAPAVLLFGRESSGLPPRLRERRAQRLLRIPMASGAPRSLNLSSAVAVAVYEARRQLGWNHSAPTTTDTES
jgi:tRNA (cytidine/uridine-2'-O-)-methyltransferase